MMGNCDACGIKLELVDGLAYCKEVCEHCCEHKEHHDDCESCGGR